MSIRGKRYTSARSSVEAGVALGVDESLEKILAMPSASYDETILATICLGVDPAKNDQMVRSSVVLPKGLGKSRKVIVFAKGEKVTEANEAGADEVGLDELVEKVQGGWTDFDVAIATPDVMGNVAKVAKVLGPRGLMPNPKTGTVTFDVGQAVSEAKAGKVEFRIDKGANLHVPIGKKSFVTSDLKENLDALVDAVIRSKPSSSKGVYLRKIFVSPSAGPSVMVDASQYRK